uniref:Peroxisomal ATPase PEX1 n=1 Tax=Phallusia mammillata TaxID=59560 RepID=A0A6F9DNL9_9ASCI|nr:peroxisome biogenesis protein 1-like [Phallusia mammillata]
MKVTAEVKFSSVKNCLGHVSPKLLSTINQQKSDNEIIVAKIESTNGNCYFSLVPFIGEGSPNELRINGLYANKLAMKNGSSLLLESIQNVPVCVSAWIEPLTPDDWEILELHANEVEMHLLDQLRIVWPGQVFPLWVDKNVCIYMRVVKTEPTAECTTLMHLSELIIEPKVKSTLPKIPAQAKSKTLAKLPQVTAQTNDSVPKETVNCQNKDTGGFLIRLKIFCRLYDAVKFIVMFVWKQLLPNLYAHLKSLIFPNENNDLPIEYTSGKLNIKDLRNQMDSLPHNFDIVMRVEPLDQIDPTVSTSFIYNQANTVFLHLSDTHPDKNAVLYLVLLTKLMSPKEKLEVETKNAQQKGKVPEQIEDMKTDAANPTCVVRMYVHPQSNFAMSCDISTLHHLKVPHCLRKQMKIGNCSKVRLTKLNSLPLLCDDVNTLELEIIECSKDIAQSDIKNITHWFRQWIDSVCDVDNPLPISVGTILYFPTFSFPKGEQEVRNDLEVVISAITTKTQDKHNNKSTYLLSPDDLQKIKLNFAVAKSQNVTSDVDPVVPVESFLLHCNGMETHVADLSHCLELAMKSRPIAATLTSNMSHLSAILVTGCKGTGKSTLCNAALRKFGTDTSIYAYTAVINCSKLSGKKPENIRRKLDGIVSELLWKQPSILLLDDLDHLTPKSSDEDKTPDAMYSMHVACLIKRSIKGLFCSAKSKPTKVAVLVTSRSKASLHPLLTCVTEHLFMKHIHISLPNKVQRNKMLSSIVETSTDFGCPSNLDVIVEKTEGFAPSDLVKVVKRSCHLAEAKLSDRSSQAFEKALTVDVLVESLHNFVPASLQNARLHKPSPLTWENVGGLHSVKQSLMEQLVWPLKYQHIFEQVGFQAQTGILLFGPPGCGKTLVAGVVANECGLNFISVKGPELLSKYIGASEAAVRELFSRARAAAPCVLFFDEFDSLAPPRGHDSTGVTDRVVNQLLTHLDGVEPLVGVTVMAASSRPDLLDQALLRPGRLDNLLYFPLPTVAERLEILKSLSAQLPLHHDIDLGQLSKLCDNFSGADLKALLYNAQLEAVHEVCQDNENDFTSSEGSLRAEFQLYSSVSESTTISSSSAVGLELEEITQFNGLVAPLQLEQDPLSLPLSNESVADLKQTAVQLIESIQEVNMNPSHSQLQYDIEDYQICFDETLCPGAAGTKGPKAKSQGQNANDIAYYPSLHSGRCDDVPADITKSVQTVCNTFGNAGTDRPLDNSTPTLVITQQHIHTALSSTRPSLTPIERNKLDRLYAGFIRSRDKSSFNKPEYYQGKQRATLS